MSRFVDVSHSIEHGMVTYKGLPVPVISDHMSREESKGRYGPDVEFQIGKIEMVANTGTYIDSPFHRYSRGRDLAHLELEAIANLEGVVVRLERSGPEITDEVFSGIEVKDKAVLLHTGWDKHWRTDEYASGNHTFLTESGATYLAKHGAALVGIDSFNIDGTKDMNRPAHTILLGHDIPIVEHLCRLNDLPDNGFKFFAVPAKVRQFGSFPVRAFAIIN
jgi:arylformamidase